MAGTTEGGKKAAETRGHDDLAKAGKKGGEHSHGGRSSEDNNNRSRSSSQNDSDEDKGRRSN